MADRAGTRPWLLDLNVLLALCWPSHMHHRLIHQWFFGTDNRPWTSCLLTELGFVRLSSNPRFSADAVSPPEALALLNRVCQTTRHSYCDAAPSLRELDLMSNPLLAGHRQTTDAYLLALAQRQGLKLATLDRGLASLAGSLGLDHVDLVVAEH